MTISIRSLGPEEWGIFSNLRLTALKECPGVYGSNFEKEAHTPPATWQSWLRCEGQCVFGLFDDTTLIGIAGVTTSNENPKCGILWGSYITSNYRGHGLSHVLYKARIEWAITYQPWKKLIVSHRATNEASRRANQKWGFRLTHRENKIWPDGTADDQYYYELDLEELRTKHDSH